MSVTISLRVDESVKEQIEELGYSPGEFAKEALLKELKWEKRRKFLEKAWSEMLPPGERRAVDIIREDRDTR